MQENTVNKLTLDVIEESHKKFEELSSGEIELEVNGELRKFELGIYKNFSPISIKELIAEYIHNIDFARKTNRDGFGSILEPYLMYLMIKHFTTLGESMSNDFKIQLESMKHMMNTSAFFQIVALFDEDEIARLKVELELMMESFEQKSEMIQEFIGEYYHKLENKSLLD